MQAPPARDLSPRPRRRNPPPDPGFKPDTEKGARMKIEDFAGTTPPFRPEDFFTKKLQGWGVVEAPTGSLKKRFTVEAQGRLAGDIIRFRETWTYDDGHVDTLNWDIRAMGDGRYVGDEDRLEEEAEGQACGCAFRWSYVRDTPQPDGKTAKLTFHDVFYQIDEKVVIARGVAGRLGLPLATVHVTYRAVG